MHAAFAVGQKRQRIHVVRLQLRELPVLEHHARYVVVYRQLFEHILRRRNHLALAVLERLGQAHLVEEHIAELLRRLDIEAMSRLREDLLADAVNFRAESDRHLVQHRGIDAHAGLLHAQQHRDQRQVDRLVDFAFVERVHIVAQNRRQRLDDMRRLGKLTLSRFLQRMRAEPRRDIA